MDHDTIWDRNDPIAKVSLNAAQEGIDEAEIELGLAALDDEPHECAPIPKDYAELGAEFAANL
jgi:hypothetical protein